MERTWKPIAAGIMSILAGVGELIMGIIIAVAGGITFGLFGMGWLGVLGAPLIIFGVIAIVGGIYALSRRVWGLALAGSICALIGPQFILGILAIIFVILGKREFE